MIVKKIPLAELTGYDPHFFEDAVVLKMAMSLRSQLGK